jgi:hypothetical protein
MNEECVFQEYPKWVTVGDNEPVLVQNAEEEAMAYLELADKEAATLNKRTRKPKEAQE